MAAAVGRGRSRGIKNTRPPGASSPTVNPPISASSSTINPPISASGSTINPSISASSSTVNPPISASSFTINPPISASSSTVNPQIAAPQVNSQTVSSPQIRAASPQITAPQDSPQITAQQVNPQSATAYNPFLPEQENMPEAETDSIQTIAETCLDILRNPSKQTMSECYTECKAYLQEKLTAADIQTWLDVCIQSIYGDLTLTKEFVQLISSIQIDDTFTLKKQILGMVLRSLGAEKERLKPSDPPSTEESVAFAGYIVLLAEAALYIKMHSGGPIIKLTTFVLDSLQILCRPELPDQVYDAVHHVLVRYGSTLEEHLKCLADVSVIIPEMERLYDGIRGIIVHNSTKDKSRLRMLEVIERRAYQYNMPPECLTYFTSN